MLLVKTWGQTTKNKGRLKKNYEQHFFLIFWQLIDLRWENDPWYDLYVPLSASDPPQSAWHRSLLFTDFKVPCHTAACHIAACQTLQCVASFPATSSIVFLYLPDPIFISMWSLMTSWSNFIVFISWFHFYFTVHLSAWSSFICSNTVKHLAADSDL